MIPIHTSYDDAETLVFPGAITLKILLSGTQTDGSQAVFEDIVEPGVGPGRHIHHGQDETFFFLEGRFDVEVAGILHHMQPGDAAFVPRGTSWRARPSSREASREPCRRGLISASCLPPPAP